MLIVLKLAAFIKTDSLAIFSSLADSVTDLFASAVSFAAVYFSTKPATKEHRYGYGKSEALSAFLQAIFVGASGIFVIADGIKRLIYPVQIEQTAIGIAVMLFSILATVLLVLFQTYVANKTNSLAIKADRAHYTVDFLTNATVVLSLLLVHFFGFAYFDVVAALFISAYLLYNAYQLAAESVEQITDKELAPEIREKLRKLSVTAKEYTECMIFAAEAWVIFITLNFIWKLTVPYLCSKLMNWQMRLSIKYLKHIPEARCLSTKTPMASMKTGLTTKLKVLAEYN